MAAQGAFALGKSSPDLFRRRVLWIALAVMAVFTLSYLSHQRHEDLQTANPLAVSPAHESEKVEEVGEGEDMEQMEQLETMEPEPTWTFVTGRDDMNYGLTDEQCDIAFPLLYQELDRARDHLVELNRTIKERDVHVDRKGSYDGRTHGEFQCMIHDGEVSQLLLSAFPFSYSNFTTTLTDLQQLYVIKEVHGEPDRSRGLAALANMYRAISSMGDARRLIPNVEFTFDIEDIAMEGEHNKERIRWTWARPKENPWLWPMPDFDGWSYPDDGVASYVQFREDVAELETNFTRGWYDKPQQLSWRGSFAQNGDLRRALVKAASGKSWSDVKPIDWHDRKDLMNMQDFCKFQYVAHTEGNSWSGRLRYLHICDSVPIIHKLNYNAHYYPLLIASGPNQNYVEVNRNFSDLVPKMEELLADPERARAIAAESTRVFRDRYLTPAAEACYWRRMFRTWRSVMDFEPKTYYIHKDGTRKRRGVSWERFSFRQEKSFEHGFFVEDKIKDEEPE
ncbi:hypothetical protein PG993_002915 [Apiospora rasikravindrae]|uniref:Glycosyl transferase CAP10 domain-containing protein n=1 Tax=Apiospora rasikravindrae TaxID=990691 RepID=A0ABR1U092_9PEZI